MLDTESGSRWEPAEETTMATERKIKLIEQGNGLNLHHGDRVYDAEAGDLLRLTSAPGALHTDDTRGNYRYATAEIDGDVTDLTDAEFAALPSVLVTVAE